VSKTPIQVAGSCPVGHHLERTAELDGSGRPRLTWRGQCPTEGCGAYMIARRVKGTTHKKGAGSDPAATALPSTGAPSDLLTPRARRTVRKVTAYRDAPTRTKPKRRTAHGEPAGVPATAPVPAVAAAKPADQGQPGGPPDLTQHPSRRHRRLSFGGPDARDADGYVIPGIY